jgi:hypothetical protein
VVLLGYNTTTDYQEDQQSHQMGNGCDSSSPLAWHLDEYRGQKVLSTRQHAANNTDFKALQQMRGNHVIYITSSKLNEG